MCFHDPRYCRRSHPLKFPRRQGVCSRCSLSGQGRDRSPKLWMLEGHAPVVLSPLGLL